MPAHLLRLFGLHQRYHRYVPRHDYQPGESNPVADACSRDFHLCWEDLISDLAPLLPQSGTLQIWTPGSAIVSSVLSALLRKRRSPESLLVEPSQPVPSGTSGSSSACTWPLTPFSKPSRTKYLSYRSSGSEYVKENLRPGAIQSGLERLKITYGTLHKRSKVWGPRIPA